MCISFYPSHNTLDTSKYIQALFLEASYLKCKLYLVLLRAGSHIKDDGSLGFSENHIEKSIENSWNLYETYITSEFISWKNRPQSRLNGYNMVNKN